MPEQSNANLYLNTYDGISEDSLSEVLEAVVNDFGEFSRLDVTTLSTEDEFLRVKRYTKAIFNIHNQNDRMIPEMEPRLLELAYKLNKNCAARMETILRYMLPAEDDHLNFRKLLSHFHFHAAAMSFFIGTSNLNATTLSDHKKNEIIDKYSKSLRFHISEGVKQSKEDRRLISDAYNRVKRNMEIYGKDILLFLGAYSPDHDTFLNKLQQIDYSDNVFPKKFVFAYRSFRVCAELLRNNLTNHELTQDIANALLKDDSDLSLPRVYLEMFDLLLQINTITTISTIFIRENISRSANRGVYNADFYIDAVNNLILTNYSTCIAAVTAFHHELRYAQNFDLRQFIEEKNQTTLLFIKQLAQLRVISFDANNHLLNLFKGPFPEDSDHELLDQLKNELVLFKANWRKVKS